jgi:hypothetical protein
VFLAGGFCLEQRALIILFSNLFLLVADYFDIKTVYNKKRLNLIKLGKI